MSERRTLPDNGAAPAALCGPLRLMHFAVLAIGAAVLIAVLGSTAHARDEGKIQFRSIPTQFIAALGERDATSGTGAEAWGLWRVDPGPRGVWLAKYEQLKAAGGVAPAKWQFDNKDWWVEEHGLIMEKPDFPVPPGKYIVTGGREAVSMLTVFPADNDGAQRWELSNDTKLYDVTHLPCRSARYSPKTDDGSCTPAKAELSAFPVSPGAPMPPIEGCIKQDYAVLFVIAVAVDN